MEGVLLLLDPHITGRSPVHCANQRQRFCASWRGASFGTAAANASALCALGSVFWDAIAEAGILPALVDQIGRSTHGLTAPPCERENRARPRNPHSVRNRRRPPRLLQWAILGSNQ